MAEFNRADRPSDIVDKALLFYKAINFLNKQGRQGDEAYFDCLDEGVLHVYWRGKGWKHTWITLEPFPIEDMSVKDAG